MSMPFPKDPKSILRTRLRAERLAMKSGIVESGSLEIQKHLSLWLKGKSFSAVAAYFGIRNEPVIHPVMDLDQPRYRRWFFPRILSDSQMEFVSWKTDESLQTGRFGIKEPKSGERLNFDGSSILILMPCVAVDRSGNRLGNGAGYYDRFLHGLPDRSRVTLVAVAWERFLLEEKIPAEPFDVRVDAVLTENGFFDITGPSSLVD
jgi:5-formyltetrahydrofolate cyclo-ligase